MNTTTKRWITKTLPAQEKARSLAEALNINAYISAMLVQRNIETFEEAKNFFRPSLSQLHDPFLMRDMEKAVTRLMQAIAGNERILIYGDYDVDGTTSVSVFYGFLKNYYTNIEYYIPDRYKEGYGVSKAGIEYARDTNATLIVSLDCGIRAVEMVAYANSFGIDFIICDHHNPGNELPDAVAILDPKQNNCSYPYKELSGCGVGFKLLQALCTRAGYSSELLFEQIDLLAISICSDIVPITGENRILTYFGLQKLNESPRPGIQAIVDVSGLKKAIDVNTVVFTIGPRINAAGRIDHAFAAVELLLAENKTDAANFAANINDHNLVRREFDETITGEALGMIQSNANAATASSTVLYKNDWHKGVIGIVASRCIEHYHRPTIILTQSNGKVAGSARSVPDYDLYEAIDKCSDLLIQFGGHKYAAGLTMEEKNIEAFRTKFEEVVSATIRKEQLIPMISIDLELPLNQIDSRFFNIVRQMGPFGPQNMQPIFVSRNVMDDGTSRILKDKHLKLNIRQQDSVTYPAIGWQMHAFYDRIKNKEPFDICYSLEENEFNGKKTIQLMIRDIQFIKDRTH
ncbi:single-stranded-DNA-specific exonuclease RecJ [Cytophaga hutchinsonii]|uniref:Single-stranded-DNA-specific exonuclease RecJ n=1 Tax=Cytophaga hutchinsonii (strain ATCC 33406 / DSM 1761 / CIP 103989 / NBRC 15051 / NCIMB 9469 / D465) TaxID=269798 RepID=A0A6N4SWU0_CYTH3|nr:single-stranded-DNA-specific exonuclease RecJ [Cytophaga hutchinsonii]ABG60901.1 exonuclease RecJ [Cytophaga hutchinsonii ATCC 33406]SFX42160.1 exonuclease RecJ [Cytophaga hutchinsonii ATCC 33406]